VLELSTEDKVQNWRLQLQWAELEIENQKALLKVEQNRAQQQTLMNAIQLTAFNHAQAHGIDLNIYELDSREMKFVKKKKP
jgi:hypothetical protein